MSSYLVMRSPPLPSHLIAMSTEKTTSPNCPWPYPISRFSTKEAAFASIPCRLQQKINKVFERETSHQLIDFVKGRWLGITSIHRLRHFFKHDLFRLLKHIPHLMLDSIPCSNRVFRCRLVVALVGIVMKHWRMPVRMNGVLLCLHGVVLSDGTGTSILYSLT